MPVHSRIKLDESLRDMLVFSKGQHCKGELISLSPTVANRSIFSCIQVQLNWFSTNPRQIFSNNSLDRQLWSTHSAKVLQSHHGRNLIVQDILQLLTYMKKLTICGEISPLMLRAITNRFFKGHKCRTIQMNVLDYKGLKSKTVKNNKLEVSRTIKPLTMRMMCASQQRVFKVAQNSFQHFPRLRF